MTRNKEFTREVEFNLIASKEKKLTQNRAFLLTMLLNTSFLWTRKKLMSSFCGI